MNDIFRGYLTNPVKVGEVYINSFKQKIRIICVDRKNSSKYPVIGLTVFDESPYQESIIYFDSHGVSISSNRNYDLVRKYNPLDDLTVDTPIWVKLQLIDEWLPRHFAQPAKDGKGVIVYADGKTSHTGNDRDLIYFPNYTLKL